MFSQSESCVCEWCTTSPIHCLIVFRPCPVNRVLLHSETFVVRKRRLTLSLTKLRQNAEKILKTYELYIYGYVHYIAIVVCKNVRKITTP